MSIRFRFFVFAAALALLLPFTVPCSLAQAPISRQPQPLRPVPQPASHAGYHLLNDLSNANSSPYPGPAFDTSFANARSFAELAESARQAAYDEYMERQRHRAEADERALERQRETTEVHANPDAPDLSEMLKNSHDREFILHNFRTMYVEAHDARYFGSDQLKGALGRNKEFEKLHISIVDDPRVADVVLKVSYTFAWDYPFELRHQNTTFVLLAGKGEGPFSGPLGAADVARQFVNAAKPWREEKLKPLTDKDKR
jgi:hypothetical protein